MFIGELTWRDCARMRASGWVVNPVWKTCRKLQNVRMRAERDPELASLIAARTLHAGRPSSSEHRQECLCHQMRRLSFLVVVGVDFGEAGPFFREIFEGEDGGYRADGNARAAVDALIGIDVELGGGFEVAFVLAR